MTKIATKSFAKVTGGNGLRQVAKIISLDNNKCFSENELNRMRDRASDPRADGLTKRTKFDRGENLMRRIRGRAIAGLATAVLLWGGLVAFGQQLTNGEDVPVQFTGGYSAVFEDYGAGIYTGIVNGTSTGIICDDFNDEITSGEEWNAYAYNVSTLNSSNIGETLFGSTIGLTGYAEVATLVSMMFSGSTTYGSITGITQAELSSAIWDITTKGGISGLNTTAQALVNAVVAVFSGNATKAEAYLATLTNLWILTPTPQGPAEAQEMWMDGPTLVPEGGTALMYLILAATACCGALFFGDRNRLSSRRVGA